MKEEKNDVLENNTIILTEPEAIAQKNNDTEATINDFGNQIEPLEQEQNFFTRQRPSQIVIDSRSAAKSTL